jgi:hypothetical protein
MRSPIIKILRDYMLACPIIEDMKALGVDYLGTGDGAYSIDSVPGDTIVKRYVDGSAQKQYLFVFASKEFYDSDPLENLDNLGFYEKLEAWFEEMTEKDTLPVLDGGRTSLKLEALTSGYIFDASEETRARYQIQARLLYLDN